MTRSVPNRRGDDLAFLRVGSDERIALVRALRGHAALNAATLDDRRMHLLVAKYLERVDGEPNFEELEEYLNREIAKEHAHDPVTERLIDARVSYEHFFDGEPRWRIDGWSDDSIALASDLYSRSNLEIAATVWHNLRSIAKARFPTSSVKVAPLEFDHRLLGSGRHVLVSKDLTEYEPFFETLYPVIGVCGVNGAWMYLNTDELDWFGSEIVAHLTDNWPEAGSMISELDVPIVGRPLGFESVRFAAEALVRHLTVREAAEVILDRLIKYSDRDIDLTDSIVTNSANLDHYIEAVVNVGSLARPATLDHESSCRHAAVLAAKLVQLYRRRENVFSAWNRYVDFAKAAGVAVREFTRECNQIRSFTRLRRPEHYFTATSLRKCVELLDQGLTPTDVVQRLYQDKELALESTARRFIRVSGPSSPAIVT